MALASVSEPDFAMFSDLPSRHVTHATQHPVARATTSGRWAVAVLVCGTAVTLLSACGAKKDKPVTQVAAKVNAEEISVHQINFLLQQQRGMRPEQLDQASRATLERLIDQEIALQKAVETGLDRDARVLQALDAARREVLARAYLERQADTVDRPTPQAVDAYYNEKPALFRNRRIYTVEEFSIDPASGTKEKVQALLQASKSSAAFGDALKAANIRYITSTATRPAEAVPLELLDRIAALSSGQGVVLTPPNSPTKAFVLLSSVAAPVTIEQARPAIEQYLLNDAKRTKLASEVKALRAAAKVQYAGQFASPPPAAGAVAVDAPAVPVGTGAATATPSAEAPPPSAASAESINKGVKGLK